MAGCLVVFSSLNQVALLKRSLYQKGVFVEMQRTPHCLSTTGCGFAIRCERYELRLLEEECRRLSIEHGGTFEEEVQNGTLRYRFLDASEFGR